MKFRIEFWLRFLQFIPVKYQFKVSARVKFSIKHLRYIQFISGWTLHTLTQATPLCPKVQSTLRTQVIQPEGSQSVNFGSQSSTMPRLVCQQVSESYTEIFPLESLYGVAGALGAFYSRAQESPHSDNNWARSATKYRTVQCDLEIRAQTWK